MAMGNGVRCMFVLKECKPGNRPQESRKPEIRTEEQKSRAFSKARLLV
jgi:hypothetical protein